MKILITGHKGFIGHNLLEELSKEHDVTTFTLGEPLPEVKGLDWCIHLGAETSSSLNNVEMIIDRNYDFSRWLLNQCQENNVNFQYASAAEIYGNFRNFKETAPSNPLTPYAWSKFLFDRYIEGFSGRWTIRIQAFRYFDVFSDVTNLRNDNNSFYANFARQAEKENVIKIFYGSSHYFRDFIHIDKVIDIHKKFLNIEESGLWNVGSGSPTSIETVAKQVAKKLNVGIEYVDMPETLRHRYRIFSHADISKLNKTLNK